MNKKINLYLQSFMSLPRQMSWSYLPPLAIYLVGGMAGITAIVGMFFVKEHLNLSAPFLAGLGFWAGLPWALKLPIGYLVDFFWKRKNYIVCIGAFIMSISSLIMYKLIADTSMMMSWMSIEKWFVLSSILAPIGYVIQDVVADAMTIEAVPTIDAYGNPYSSREIKNRHTILQSLGRLILILGVVLVSLINITVFQGIKDFTEAEKIYRYSHIYFYSAFIPFVSMLGIWLLFLQKKRKNKRLSKQASIQDVVAIVPKKEDSKQKISWFIVISSILFISLSVSIGMIHIPFGQEIICLGSFSILILLMRYLTKDFTKEQQRNILIIGIIIFCFRALPGPGPGLLWFEMDRLSFDEQFFSSLSLISSILTIVGIILLQPFVAKNSIIRIIVILSIVEAILLLPSIGMYYGIQNWTASITGGVVDAKFIAIINTAMESPLRQISLIPMLAWLAQNAPQHMKATFFAVFGSFSNLAMSAGLLGTKYLNQIFSIKREVKDSISHEIITQADYSELGRLLLTVLCIMILFPIILVLILKKSRLTIKED